MSLRASTALVLAVCVAMAPGAQAAPPAPSGAPKLVVLLSIDQMRADYIDRYGSRWKDGLARVLREGAHFTNARFPYLSTVTCAGHATLGTGAYPHRHGMVLNAWWDRGVQALTACTADSDSPVIPHGPGSPTGGDSARRLLVSTLADEMKRAATDARVVSFSVKARSAITLGGSRPDVVAWYDEGNWVSARAFTAAPYATVSKVVRANPIERQARRAWTRLLPSRAYDGQDDVAEEHPMPGWNRAFPHPLRLQVRLAAIPGAPAPSPWAGWEKSPFTDEYLLRLARAAVKDLRLGRGPSTDYLAVSFSALDAVGHAFGPRSHEVQDVLLRLDRLVGELLRTLDAQVGKGRYVVALSADHGVAAFPEQLKAEGEDAGRVPIADLGARLTAALEKELGPGPHVASMQYTDVYLLPGAYDRLKSKPGAVARVLDVIRQTPGVAAAFSTDELRKPHAASEPLQRAAALSHHPGRSGDLILVPKPRWLTTSAGTTHGTQNDYDQHVPVLLFGAGVKPGRYTRAVSPADVAPTLARMVGVALPQAEGSALVEALAIQTASAPALTRPE